MLAEVVEQRYMPPWHPEDGHGTFLDPLRLTDEEIASEYEVHANQISQWKKEARESLPEVFGQSNRRQEAEQEQLVANLYEEIGRLKMELDWLKKKSKLLP